MLHLRIQVANEHVLNAHVADMQGIILRNNLHAMTDEIVLNKSK